MITAQVHIDTNPENYVTMELWPEEMQAAWELATLYNGERVYIRGVLIDAAGIVWIRAETEDGFFLRLLNSELINWEED